MSSNIVVVESNMNMLPGQVKFWKFDQNNPGGSFILDQDHAEDMWFQAVSGDDANRRAESYGLRLDGNECDCCGSRWSSQTTYYDTSEEIPLVWMDDGTKEGKKLDLLKTQLWLDSQSGRLPWWAPGCWTPPGLPWAIVVLIDGTVIKYLKPDPTRIVVQATVGLPAKEIEANSE